MIFYFGSYTSVLLIFFTHLIVFSVLLYRKAYINESIADKWLSLLLFLGAFYLCPWMLGFAGWYDNQPYRDILFYVPFVQSLLIGPVLFFYLQSQLNIAFRFQKSYYWHFFPAFLWFVYHVIAVIVDVLIVEKYTVFDGLQDPDFTLTYQLSGLLSLTIYLVLSYRYYRQYRILIDEMLSYAETVRFRWIRNFLIAFLLFVTLTLLFDILPFLGYDLDYRGDWWYYFLFGVLFYYISIEGLLNANQAKIEILEDMEQTKLNGSELENLPIWKEKVLKLVVEEGAFQNPELTLPDLAKQLKTNPTFLSKVINQGFQMNFNDFVNEKRVQAVIEKLKLGEQKQFTLLAIALDCGFNSKATFNRAFKKNTGEVPKDYNQMFGNVI